MGIKKKKEQPYHFKMLNSEEEEEGTASATELSQVIADALRMFVKLDTEGNGSLSFKQLRDTMLEQNLLVSKQNKAIYNMLIKSEGTITQKDFIDELQKLFDDKDEDDVDNLKKTQQKVRPRMNSR